MRDGFVGRLQALADSLGALPSDSIAVGFYKKSDRRHTPSRRLPACVSGSSCSKCASAPKRLAREKSAQLNAALNNMAHGLCLYDAEGRIIV
jgi:hypothetical protein